MLDNYDYAKEDLDKSLAPSTSATVNYHHAKERSSLELWWEIRRHPLIVIPLLMMYFLAGVMGFILNFGGMDPIFLATTLIPLFTFAVGSLLGPPIPPR